MARWVFDATGLDPLRRYRIDTASGSASPAVLTRPGNDLPIADSVLQADAAGRLPRFVGPSQTLYAKVADYTGAFGGTPVTLTGGWDMEPGPKTSSSAVSTWLSIDPDVPYIIRDGYGGRWTAVGANSYILSASGDVAAQTLNTAAGRSSAIRRLRGGGQGLLRVWAAMPVAGTRTWAARAAEIRGIVDQAERAGVRLILTLALNGGQANDGTGSKEDGSWYQASAWRTAVTGGQSLEEWARYLLPEYADRPVVSFVDLMNEPHDTSAAWTADIARYVSEMGALVRTLLPRTLRYVGIPYPAYVGGDTAYDTITASGVDCHSWHHYDAIGFVSSKASVIQAARRVVRPVLIDEFGVWAGEQYGAYSDASNLKDTNGFPAMDYAAASTLVQSEIETALSINEVAAVCIWSLKNTDDNAWFDGLPRYEPLVGGAIDNLLRQEPIRDRRLTADRLPSSLQAAFCAVHTARYKPGDRIGGPNSGNTVPYLLYSLDNKNYRQSTQAVAPIARRGLVPADKSGYTQSIEFDGASWFPISDWTTGTGSTHHVFLVIVPTALPSSGQYQYLISPNGLTSGLGLRINSSGQVELIQYGSVGNPTPTVIGTSSTTLTLNKDNLIEARWDASGGNWRVRLNNSSSSSSGTTAKTLASGTAYLGAAHDGTQGFVGHLRWAAKFSSVLGAGDRARITQALVTRWQFAA